MKLYPEPVDQSSQSLASVYFTHSYGHSFCWSSFWLLPKTSSLFQQEPCMTHKLYRLLLSRESLLTDLGCQFRKQESLASSHPREPVLWTQIRCSGFDT